MSNLTKEQLLNIIESADEVLTAIDGTNEVLHRDDSVKMCAAWDKLNDVVAPPEVVKRLAEIALAVLTAEPVAFTSQTNLDALASKPTKTLEFMTADESVYREPIALFTRAAPPVTFVVKKPRLTSEDDFYTESERLIYESAINEFADRIVKAGGEVADE